MPSGKQIWLQRSEPELHPMTQAADLPARSRTLLSMTIVAGDTQTSARGRLARNKISSIKC
jgi:hypothetical protein